VPTPSRLTLVLVALLLSGCMGGHKTATQDATGTSLAPQTSNALYGFIFDNEQLPVAEARVQVEGVDDVRTTNEAGTYRFNDLPPGEHTVRVEKEGFRTGVERASIRDGYATIVNVTLEPAPKDVFHETVPFNGQLACHATLGDDPETGTAYDCNQADPNSKASHEFLIKPGAVQVQLEIFWTPTTAAASNLTVRVETVDRGTLNVVFANQPGPPGMKVSIGEANIQKYFANGAPVRVTLSSGPSVRHDPVPMGAGLALEQPYEVDFTTFFGEPGPSDFRYRAP